MKSKQQTKIVKKAYTKNALKIPKYVTYLEKIRNNPALRSDLDEKVRNILKKRRA